MNNLTEYHAAKACSVQWVSVLRALADELAQSLDHESLGQIFYAAGARLYSNLAVQSEGNETLDALAAALNKVWFTMDWGVCSFDEQPDALVVIHRGSPLVAAFGADSLPYAAQLLAAFYQCVFDDLGASDSTRVEFIGDDAGGLELAFAVRA